MSASLTTGGYESGPSSGGGGGGSPSGIVISFVLIKDDGSGDFADSEDLSGAGVVQVRAPGGSWTNIAGDPPAFFSDGTYEYTLDESEVVSPWVMIKVMKTGVTTLIEREDINAGFATTADLNAAAVTIVGTIDSSIAASTSSINANVDDSFNSDDRASLQGLRDDYTTIRAGKLDHLDMDISDIEVSVDNAAVAAAVLDTVIEGSITVADALRGTMAALVAKATDVTSNTVIIKGVFDVGKTRWTITKDATGRLSVEIGDLT